MYKYAGMGLLGLFIVMIFPSGSESIQDGMNLYGAATIDVFDRDGNSVFRQTVHNQLFDQGEGFILDQTFTDLTTTGDTADAVQVGAICLSEGTPLTDETQGAANFDSANTRQGTTTQNCVSPGGPNQSISAVTNSSSVVTIGPLNFGAGDTGDANINWTGGDTIESIGICLVQSDNSNATTCQTILFAVVDTSDVTLQNSETVDITYTFDLSSAGT